MRILMRSIVLLFATLTLGTALAQEHYTDGPVWGISTYQIEPDQGDAYLKWLRSHALRNQMEAKKQGLILDWKIFVQERATPGDWDIAIATLYPSYGKAMDYSAADEAKWDAIQAETWKTADKDKQREASAPRLAMRKYLGTRYVREVTLKPMP
jgi:hypothetical protein